MDEKIKLLISELGEIRVKQNIDIGDYLASKKSVQVRAFYLATNIDELIKVILLCQELEINYLLIGSGSKISFSDNNLKGLVIKNRCDNLKIFGIKGKVSRDGLGIQEATIEADAGISLQGLAAYTKKQLLTGLEDLERYPGTLGGSIFMNQTLRNYVHELRVLDKSGKIVSKGLAELNSEDVILSVYFKLKSKPD